MTESAMVERCRRVTTLDKTAASLAEAMAALRDVRLLQGFFEGEVVAWTRRVAELTPIAEHVVATASGLSDREAIAIMDRVAVVDQVPELGVALAAGTLRAGHVDRFRAGLRALDGDQRAQLLDAAPDLVELAGRSTVDDFGKAVRAEVRRIQADGGMTQLQRQQRACRASTWVDPEGMWNLKGRFDPETGARLTTRLDTALAAIEAGAAPAHAPEDPMERRAFLFAHALAGLVEGHGPGSGPAELLIALDATRINPDGAPTVDWGIPVEIPLRILADMYQRGQIPHISPVILCRGVVIHAPGELNLGRTTRLANRPQRRALRAMYPTCAIPGCSTRFADCDIHHVIYWEAPHDGRTDLDNLLPLCSRHHHDVHDRGWTLALTADRTLTITHPDHSTRTTPPPRRAARPGGRRTPPPTAPHALPAPPAPHVTEPVRTPMRT